MGTLPYNDSRNRLQCVLFIEEISCAISGDNIIILRYTDITLQIKARTFFDTSDPGRNQERKYRHYAVFKQHYFDDITA